MPWHSCACSAVLQCMPASPAEAYARGGERTVDDRRGLGTP